MKKIEMNYYNRYSENRYNMTNLKHITTFIKKQYEFIGYKINTSNSELFNFLKELVSDSLSVNRFDILSRYQEHNNSPSARNFHSSQIFFIIEGKYIYYDIYEDIFISGPDTNNKNINKNKIYICGYSDIMNISRFYSEFSLYLACLDAGHLLANIKNFFNKKNLRWNWENNILFCDILKESLLETEETFGMFILSFNKIDGDIRKSNFYVGKKTISYSKGFSEIANTEYLKDLRILFNSDSRQINKKISNFGIYFDMVRNRNSAHNMVGNFNLLADKTINDDILNNILNILKSFVASLEVEVDYCFLRKTKIIYSNGVIENKVIDFKKILYNDHEFFDLDTYDLVFVVFSNQDLILSEGLKQTLLSCGQLMQATCVQFSRYNKSFRPMKNHNDIYLKEILNLTNSYKINYIGIECNNPVKEVGEYD